MTTLATRGITETDVWQAADTLLLEGARPTIERVRLKIGRGSPNTVSPYLDTWFKTLGARIADPNAFAAPPALPDPISQAAQHFWDAAMAAARAETAAALAAGRAEIAQARAALEDERTQLQAEAAKAAAQAQAKEEALQVMRVRAKEFQHRVTELSADVDQRNATIEALRFDIARLQTNQETLRRQLDAERSAFESARQELDERAKAHENRWAQEIDRAREATKSANARFVELEKNSGVRIRELNQTIDAGERDHRSLVSLNEQLKSDAERLRAQRTASTKAFDESQRLAQAREAQLLAQCERVQAQLSESLEQLAAKDREHGDLLRSLIADARKAEAAEAAKLSPDNQLPPKP